MTTESSPTSYALACEDELGEAGREERGAPTSVGVLAEMEPRPNAQGRCGAGSGRSSNSALDPECTMVDPGSENVSAS